MAMKGINLIKGHGSRPGSEAWLLLAFWALSPYSVKGAAAAQVCTTNNEGKTICHDKLSVGAIAAIIVTIVLVLLLCAGIYYIVRRTRMHRRNDSLANTFVIPALGYSSRGRRRDEEEGDFDDDDEKYLSVEKNQIHGPAWEATYDPSSAPLPGKGSSSWSSRLRNIKSGGMRSGADYYDNQPMSAPGHGRRGKSSGGSFSASSAVKKPRSAGSDAPSMSMVSKSKRHWGSLIHGSQSKNGSMSAGPSGSFPNPEPAKQARTRAAPGLQIIAEAPGGFNLPTTPRTPYTPRTPSRLGTAPPVSAGPIGSGFSSATTAPRTGAPGTPLTPVPMPAYSPVTPRGHVGAI